MKITYLGGKLMKGEGLKNSLLQKIIENTHNPKAEKNIYDSGEHYRLDEELTTRTIRIYYCIENKNVIISHSSTLVDIKEFKQSYNDIKDDITMFFLGAENTTRYKVGYKTQLAAEEKYDRMNYHIINVGYSLGSQIAKEFGERKGTKVDEVVIYNKPVLLSDIVSNKGVGPNTHEISTSNDITSTLRPVENYFRPPGGTDNQYVFDSQTNNPFKAHSFKNLEKLPDDQYFGDDETEVLNVTQRPNPTMIISSLQGNGLDIKKMTVRELKIFIKEHRPKGQTYKYKVNKVKKRGLQMMVEHLISLNY